MARCLFLLAAAFAVAVGRPTAPITHWTRFAHSNGTHEYLNTTSPNVNIIDFTEICNGGIWMVHKNPNYESVGMDGTVTILYQPNGCATHIDPPVRSARRVGIQTDNTIPSISLFSATSMGGLMHVTVDGQSDVEFSVLSFVSIGLDYVEFFEKRDFEGKSFCIKGYSSTQWVWTLEGFDAPFEPTQAKSVRPGCRNPGAIITFNRNGKNTNV